MVIREAFGADIIGEPWHFSRVKMMITAFLEGGKNALKAIVVNSVVKRANHYTIYCKRSLFVVNSVVKSRFYYTF